MNDEIRIDGSQGEGGGQILRTSLGLSLVTGRPVSIAGIRAGRSKPGLMRQHLTAVQAAVAISNGQADGASIGSRELRFVPGPICPGHYTFSIGTAGSASLVLQTVLPALLLADAPSTLVLEGGTHNPWAPPFDFLDRAYRPLVNRMGPRLEIELERVGFYPAGGGRIKVHVEPAPQLIGFDLLERGAVRTRQARIVIANLPLHIARRELETVRDKLGWNNDECSIDEISAAGPGNVVVLTIDSEQVTEVFCAFGREGCSAERVATEVSKDVRDYLKSNAPVGPYLADQLLLPLGLSAWGAPDAGGQRGGAFLTGPLSRHSTTHADLLRRFLGISIDIESQPDRTCLVRVSPSAE